MTRTSVLARQLLIATLAFFPARAGAAGGPDSAVASTARPAVPNLTGAIRERGTGQPISDVLVTLFRQQGKDSIPLTFEATSDSSGSFRFFDVPAGTWQVLIGGASGYLRYRTNETIHGGEALTATYYLERASYNRYEVTVTAGRPRKEVSRTVLTGEELQKLPGTVGDPLAAVLDLPSVARPPLLTGQLIVRGSAPEDSRVFLEGTEIPLIYHFGGVRSVVPVGIVDSLTFVPGNYGIDFGRATGGIVDLRLKTLRPTRVSGYADVSVVDGGAYIEAPLGAQGGIALSARRSYLDLVLKEVLPEDPSFKTAVAPHYYDYQLLANYRLGARHEVRGLFLGSADRFTALYTNPAEISTQLQGGGFSDSATFYRSLLAYHYAGPWFDNVAQASAGRAKSNVSTGQRLTALDISSAQLRDTAHVRLGSRATLSFGTDTVLSQTGGTIREPPIPKEGQPPSNPDLSQIMQTTLDARLIWYPSLFGELSVTPVPNLLLVAGARGDYFGRIAEIVTQPRFTARYQLTPRLTLKGGVGLYAQEPTLDETDPTIGNPALSAERAVHYAIGGELRPLPAVTFDMTVFYKALSHLVRPTDAQAVDDAGTVRPLRYDNAGVGRAYGVEVIARHDFSHHFTGWLAYTLSRSERRNDSGTGYRLFDFDQTHILTVLWSYVLPRNWQVGGRFRFTSGDPMTPVVGAVFNAGTDQYDPTFGPVNSVRRQVFHQLDLRVDKRWIMKRWILDAYVDIQNVYNRANEEQTGYNFDFRKTTARSGIPILPIIGLRADF